MVEKYIEKREIKFRVWDNGKRKWLSDKEICSRIGVNSVCKAIGELLLHDTKDYVSVLEKLEFVQYTGLKDKNGTEIYEGDILDYCNREAILVLRWGEDIAGFYVDTITKRTMSSDDDIRLYRSEVIFEVIGNVFETPELLESKIEGARTTRKQPSKGVARARPKLDKPTGLPSGEYKEAFDAAFHS